MSNCKVFRWMNEVRIIGGGFGWEAVRHSSHEFQDHPAWSSMLLREDPTLVKDIHKSFLRAGCDVILTNTYQAAPSTLSTALGIDENEAQALMKKAVLLATQAVNEFKTECNEEVLAKRLEILIAGALGPYDACQASGSEYDPSSSHNPEFEKLVQFHVKRAQILHCAGVSFLAWETISSLLEVSAIVETMNRLPDKACASLSIFTKNGYTTIHGEPLHLIASLIEDCNKIFAIGVNCHIKHEYIPRALAALGCLKTTYNIHTNPSPAPMPKRPKILFAYPSSGEVANTKKNIGTVRQATVWDWPKDLGSGCWARSVAKYAVSEEVLRLQSLLGDPFQISHELGLAQWIGGCCRVKPDDISELVMRLKPGITAESVRCSVSAADEPSTSDPQTQPATPTQNQEARDDDDDGRKKKRRKC